MPVASNNDITNDIMHYSCIGHTTEILLQQFPEIFFAELFGYSAWYGVLWVSKTET